MKYKLFRSPGNLDKAIRKHELVAVETGKNIDDVAVVGQREPLDHGDIVLDARLGLDCLGLMGDLDDDAVGMAATPLMPRDHLTAGLQEAIGEDSPPEVVRADPFPGRIVGQKDVVLLYVGMALGCPPGVIMPGFLLAICH